MVEFPWSMTWVVKGCAKYESDWIALHRFLWMNAISGQDLWRALTGRKKRDVSLPSSKTFPAQYIELITEISVTSDFAKHFHARSLSNCFGPNNGREMLAVKDIRFCPSCLRECFHSPLFQLATVRKCPVHGCELLDACEHCGAKVGSPEFEPRWFNIPLACQHCHLPFCGEHFADKALGGFLAGEETFMNIEEWLQQLRSVQFLRAAQLGGEPWSPRDYKTICDCLVHLASDASKGDSWQDIKFPCTVSNIHNEEERSTTYVFARKNRYVPLDQDLEAACRIAKSVNRYLSKHVKAICGHRRTAHLSWENAQRPFQPVQPILVMSLGDCPCCAILDQWRAYAGKLIALRNLARRVGNPVYELGLNDFRAPFSLEPTVCAEALISSFTWFANSLTRLLLQISGQGTQLWYAEEDRLLEFMCQSKALSLDVYRFDIRPHWYVFSVRGEEVGIAYSLRHAFDSLRACQALHHKGSLWQVDGFETHQRSHRTRDDDWYVSMSEYLHTRQSSHSWARIPTPIPAIYGYAE